MTGVLRLSTLLCAVLAVALIGTGNAEAQARPNVVLVLTDDQRWDTLNVMPTVQRQLVDRGVTFENAVVVNPVCCPSRASTLTGRYSHSTGVYNNGGPYGGWPSFRTREGSTIATWLRSGGYRTGFFGKYLNNYGTRFVPPGWSRWVAFAPPNVENYYTYRLNIDGSMVDYGSDPGDYSTDVLAAKATDFIDRTAAPAPRPSSSSSRPSRRTGPQHPRLGTRAPLQACRPGDRRATTSQTPPTSRPGCGPSRP